MGRLPNSRRDADYLLRDRGVNPMKIRQILDKANFEKYWHEAPPAVTGYHSRYSLNKHFEGLGKETKYGFELEIEYRGNGSAHEIAYKVYDLAVDTLGEGLIRMETDGSLSNGIEIITAPLSEQAWRQKYSKLYLFLRGLKKLGFVSHNPGSCGLHIHITRPEAKVVGKIENLILKNNLTKQFWKDLSRRKDRTSYANFEKQRTNAQSKYFALNKLNPSTIEMRLFRGTLKPSSFFASLESTFALVNFTTKGTAGSWRQFVEYVHKNKGYKYFLQFVGKNMCNDWKIPPVKPRVRLSLEQRLERDRLNGEKKKLRQVTQWTRRQYVLNNWLNSMENTSRYISDHDINEVTQEIRCCQVVITRRCTQEDMRLSGFVTPISFKQLSTIKYNRPRCRPRIELGRVRGWGYSRTWGRIQRCEQNAVYDITGQYRGSVHIPGEYSDPAVEARVHRERMIAQSWTGNVQA